MSLRYDALRPPDPRTWLAHAEAERIEAVEAYHRKHRLHVPNLLLHATFHVVVENQVALGEDTPVHQTLIRLMEEGLDRHDAVHAIGSVLASHVYDILKAPEVQTDPNAAYYSELRQLTAVSWRASGSS
jgi:hypothetical protein